MGNGNLSFLDHIQIARYRMNGVTTKEIAELMGKGKSTIDKVIQSNEFKVMQQDLMKSTIQEYGKLIAQDMKRSRDGDV